MNNPFNSFIERADRILAEDISSEEKLSKIMKIANHFSDSIEKKVERNKVLEDKIRETSKRYSTLANENKMKGTVDVQTMNHRISEVLSSLLVVD